MIIHDYGREIETKAYLPVTGSLDLCFMPRDQWQNFLPALMHIILPFEKAR